MRRRRRRSTTWLLLGDGESWSRQTVDFSGLPEMARTFLQVAAGAADIPVTRLLGQSPSGLSATGESDVRNYYDMIAARQELDLRPQLERLDRLILWSEGIDEGALTFAFRPLWQMDEPARAALALSRAQATQVYAGLKLWPDAVIARLVEAQLVADGTYPNAAAVFAEAGAAASGASPTLDYDPDEPRDLRGWWTRGGASTSAPAGAKAPAAVTRNGVAQQPGGLAWLLNELNPIGTAQAQEVPPEPPGRREDEPADADELQPGEVMQLRRFKEAWEALKELDPENSALQFLRTPGALPTDAETELLERAAREIIAARTCNPQDPTGLPEQGASGEQGATTPPGMLLRAPGTVRQPLPPSPTPGEVSPERADDPTAPVHAIEVPPGLALAVDGGTVAARAKAYEAAARIAFDFDPAEGRYRKGDSVPDGVRGDLALEVKYVDSFPVSLRNPGYSVPFPNSMPADDVAQAEEYEQEFADGVLWVTNSQELADIYVSTFRALGLTRSRVVVVPAVRK